jgi:hypothetical protein
MTVASTCSSGGSGGGGGGVAVVVAVVFFFVFEDYRLIVERRFARPGGEASYAGVSISSW